jgi:hypothetical protein
MLVNYTTVLDRPSVSVECLTQQGVESIVEVTPASGVVSDGSSDPSLRLLLLRELRVVARTATGVVSVFVRVSPSSWDALWWCRGHLWLRCTGRLPTKARGKNHAAPGPGPATAPGVGAPAPCAGDDVVCLGGWTDLASYDIVDAPLGEKAKRGSLTYVRCT